jgi:hypothetical protein
LLCPKTLWIFYRTLMKSFVSGHTFPPNKHEIVLRIPIGSNPRLTWL